MFIILIPAVLYMISAFEAGVLRLKIIISLPVRIIISVPLLLTGLIFALWSNINLLRIGKGGPTDAFGIAITPRTKHLVITGPYRYTRNPMVFGALSCYFAEVIYLNSWLGIGIMILFSIMVVPYLKTFEERRLLEDFGEEYKNYRQKVSMIIPWPGKSFRR
jgi:protein-S-isoprenylcysteine O-methyltransferase Ste14